MAVLNNKKGGSAVLHFTSSNTVTVVGNSTSSGIAAANTDEIVSGCNLRTVIWSGSWTVARGANTYLVLSGTGTLDLSLNDMAIGVDANATLVFTLTTGTGFIMTKVGKNSTYTSSY